MKNTLKILASIWIFLLIVGGTVTEAQAVVTTPSNVAATDGLWAGWVRVTWDSTNTEGFHSVWRSDTAGGTYDTHVGTVSYDIHYLYDTIFTENFKIGFTRRLGGRSISGTFYVDDVATSNNGHIGLP